MGIAIVLALMTAHTLGAALGGGSLLLESGDYLLLEDDSRLLMES